MLDMGFIDVVKALISKMPKAVRHVTWLTFVDIDTADSSQVLGVTPRSHICHNTVSTWFPGRKVPSSEHGYAAVQMHAVRSACCG